MESKPIGRHIAHAEATSDCSLDVSRAPRDRGTVLSARFLDPARDSACFVGKPLAAALDALGANDAERAASALLQARSELAEVLLPDTDRTFRVVTARSIDESTVRVTVRCVDSVLLPDMVDAKMARVADAKALSERERQVLQLLLRGRGVEDIATMLEIAPRTVKFHQANVLQKLGADSRLDLLRVVL